MPPAENDRTSPTLLGRMGRVPVDPEAWGQFVQRYGPRIVAWSRRRGLQEADAQDVMQNVLLRLMRVMQDFEYDPALSFRAWLKTLVHHAWSDLVASRAFRTASAQPSESTLETLEARDELAEELERMYEQELLELSLQRVRLRLQPQTWQAFQLTALEGIPAEEVAKRLQIRVTSVYKARSNVQKLIQEEIRYLEESGR